MSNVNTATKNDSTVAPVASKGKVASGEKVKKATLSEKATAARREANDALKAAEKAEKAAEVARNAWKALNKTAIGLEREAAIASGKIPPRLRAPKGANLEATIKVLKKSKEGLNLTAIAAEIGKPVPCVFSVIRENEKLFKRNGFLYSLTAAGAQA